MLTTVQQKIQAFYPPGSLEQVAQRVAQSGALPKIAQEWRMPLELATELVSIRLQRCPTLQYR